MIILERRPLTSFLIEQREKDSGISPEGTKFLIILPHDIAIRNFSYTTMKRGIPSANLELVTFDDLAERVLDPDKKLGLRIVDKQNLGQIIAKIIKLNYFPLFFR